MTRGTTKFRVVFYAFHDSRGLNYSRLRVTAPAEMVFYASPGVMASSSSASELTLESKAVEERVHQFLYSIQTP